MTNNPLVADKLKGKKTVEYVPVSYEEILKMARDRVYQGYKLLSHPLSGSVKPKETPYKSIMVSTRKEEVEAQSVRIIEEAVMACGKFTDRRDSYGPDVRKDFQMIDWTLLESAFASADAW
ncbi:GrdX family protein [Mordavella massiliensis]|uniref:GrdX family protein n=1 Tax=Mordavella massiliensis TaxID=1871024 RepID=UPI001FAF4968|nr:GrdX family protein [Mordavella massiliensis]